MRQKIDVIMPSRTNDETTEMVSRCIETMRSSDRSYDFNVVIVESGHGAEVGQDKTIQFDRSVFNYNHALNLGIAETSSEWVCLMNNDLLFHPFWFSEIDVAWLTYPNIKSFSPWNGMNRYHPSVFTQFSNIYPGYRIAYELCGWAIICRREILRTIELSERVNFWYSDNVYGDEIIKHQFIHALVRHSLVDHLCSRTIDFSQYDTGKDAARYRGEA